MDFSFKERYGVYDLVDIVKKLRAPEGCPWDKVQTHETLRKDFIEEVYEAVEAIDEKSREHLREELGDVLLQVVFHCVLETEQGSFDIDDVADEVCKKMIFRHPHVFGSVTAETPEEVLKNWDQIKMQSKSQSLASEAMDSVSKALPALMRSEKLWKKAERGGLAPKPAKDAFDETQEKLDELRELIAADDRDAYQKKLGELLFSVVGMSRCMKADCERSPYDACDNFIERFRSLEASAAEKGIEIQKLNSEEVADLWNDISTH